MYSLTPEVPGEEPLPPLHQGGVRGSCQSPCVFGRVQGASGWLSRQTTLGAPPPPCIHLSLTPCSLAWSGFQCIHAQTSPIPSRAVPQILLLVHLSHSFALRCPKQQSEGQQQQEACTHQQGPRPWDMASLMQSPGSVARVPPPPLQHLQRNPISYWDKKGVKGREGEERSPQGQGGRLMAGGMTSREEAREERILAGRCYMRLDREIHGEAEFQGVEAVRLEERGGLTIWHRLQVLGIAIAHGHQDANNILVGRG